MQRLIFYTLVMVVTACGVEDKRNEQCALQGCPEVSPTATPTPLVVKGPKGDKGDKGDTGQTIQGPKGDTGKAGANSIVKLIAPCGVASSPWKEQIMCLTTGQLLASFSASESGQDTRFSLIESGDYVDTDESGCKFNVAVDDKGNSTVSWKTGSNTYSTWQADSQTCQNLEVTNAN